MCLMNECSVKFWLLQSSLKVGDTLQAENNTVKDLNLEDLFSFQVFLNVFIVWIKFKWHGRHAVNDPLIFGKGATENM